MKRKKKAISVADLKAALASKDSLDRFSIFEAYSRQRPSEEAVAVLRKALRGKDSSVVNFAARSLEKLGIAGNPAMYDLFTAAKTADESGVPQSFPECIRALVAVHADEELILEATHHWVGVTNWEIVSSGMEAMQKLGTSKAISLLRRIHAFWDGELNKTQQKRADRILNAVSK